MSQNCFSPDMWLSISEEEEDEDEASEEDGDENSEYEEESSSYECSSRITGNLFISSCESLSEDDDSTIEEV